MRSKFPIFRGKHDTKAWWLVRSWDVIGCAKLWWRSRGFSADVQRELTRFSYSDGRKRSRVFLFFVLSRSRIVVKRRRRKFASQGRIISLPGRTIGQLRWWRKQYWRWGRRRWRWLTFCHVMQLSMLFPRWGGPRVEVGTLNVLRHPRWGILANFEQKCWPRDREVWTMSKQQERTGYWMWEAWIRVFRHLESTQHSQKLKLSSCNKMEEQKEFNKPFLFNIYVLVNKNFACIPKSHRIFM